MHVVRVPKFGPPEVLEYVEQPDPEPGPGEIRTAVQAVGINFADITARMGLYPDSGKPQGVGIALRRSSISSHSRLASSDSLTTSRSR